MSTNPYQSPESQLTLDNGEFAEVKFFSPSGRINRLRYFAYAFLLMFPCSLVAGIGAALAASVSVVFWGLSAAAYLVMLVLSVFLMIQRLHDLNRAGWLAFVYFGLLLGSMLPIVGIGFAILAFCLVLYIAFAPGTRGANDFGLPPPPNKTWHWVAGLAFPFVAIIGIVAAIAIPAYQNYVTKARAAEHSQQTQPGS